MKDNIKVRIAGEVFLYNEKAPYEKSGFGEYGAMRLDSDADKVMCHECGGWFEKVSSHLHHAHGITAREYKIKHGLKFSSALCNESYRLARSRIAIERNFAERFAKNRKKHLREAVKLAAAARNRNKGRRIAEALNLRGHCMAQFLADLRDLAKKLKRTPTQVEIERDIGVYLSSIRKVFGSTPAMMEAAGLKYRKSSVHVGPRRPRRVQYTREQLLFIMQNFIKLNGRVPVCSDCKRGLLPHWHTYARAFGSWKDAQVLAQRSAAA